MIILNYDTVLIVLFLLWSLIYNECFVHLEIWKFENKHILNWSELIYEFRIWMPFILGQSYKTFYTNGQIYKPILKSDNMLWLQKYLVRLLGCYTLKYSWSSFFLRGAISNLGALFYTTLSLKNFYRIGPWLFKMFDQKACNPFYLTYLVTHHDKNLLIFFSCLHFIFFTLLF